jgi:GPH family glycoside/pentoside/hexuronide:cation symporter
MERMAKWKQVIYAGGYGGFSILDNIFGVYFMYFLLPPKESGLPELVSDEAYYGLTILGLIIIFGRIIDSIADPLLAYWSDRNKSRLGRRRFFLVTGALPFAVISVLLFTLPDNHASTANAVYAAITLGFYFFMYTYYMTPYLALIPELTHSHSERIFMTIIQALAMLIGAAVIMMGVPMIWEGLQSTAMDKSQSFIVAMIIVASLGFIFSFVAGFVVDEKRYTKGTPSEVPLFKSIKMTLSNKVFLSYMIPVILYWFTFHMTRSSVAYYPEVLLGKDEGFVTMLMVLLFGGAALFFILISYLSRKVSNKTIMAAGLLSYSMFMTLTYFIDMAGDYSVHLAYTQMFLLGFPVSVLLVIPNAIVADISEVDSYVNGLNREAMFFGTQGLFMKVFYGLAAALLAALLAEFGKDAAQPLGVKLSGPAAAVFALVGFVIFLRYPQQWISNKLEEIRSKEKVEEPQ